MLFTTPQDRAKIEAKVRAIVSYGIEAKVRTVAVRPDDFYNDCNLSKLRKSHFADEVGDVLSTKQFSELGFGAWVYAELGDGYHVFVSVAEPDVGSSVGAILESDGVATFSF